MPADEIEWSGRASQPPATSPGLRLGARVVPTLPYPPTGPQTQYTRRVIQKSGKFKLQLSIVKNTGDGESSQR
jgi:hypothetical protein